MIGTGVAALFLLALNIAVTFGIYGDETITRAQKTAHIVAVWLLPIIGGVLVLGFLASHHSRQELKQLVPFPFYMVAIESESRYSEGSDSFPEGVCGDD